MFKIHFHSFIVILVVLSSCTHQRKETIISERVKSKLKTDTVIVDCNYSFEEAIKGTKAPKRIINQLKLINVRYYSTDKRIHQGQVLTNSRIADKIATLFNYMYHTKFPIAHAIPIVKYNWDDDLSMEANNTYSFCYRDISFSKHARGMAIDINPYLNPVRWKNGYENRLNKPLKAHYDPSIPGTFYKLHPVVQEFEKLGFYWGHYFTMKHDDHHFEI